MITAKLPGPKLFFPNLNMYTGLSFYTRQRNIQSTVTKSQAVKGYLPAHPQSRGEAIAIIIIVTSLDNTKLLNGQTSFARTGRDAMTDLGWISPTANRVSGLITVKNRHRIEAAGKVNRHSDCHTVVKKKTAERSRIVRAPRRYHGIPAWWGKKLISLVA